MVGLGGLKEELFCRYQKQEQGTGLPQELTGGYCTSPVPWNRIQSHMQCLVPATGGLHFPGMTAPHSQH